MVQAKDDNFNHFDFRGALQKLRAVAARYKIEPEELIQISIDELINQPEKAVLDAIAYVLHKNAELYRRLV